MLTTTPTALHLHVKVVPNASRTQLAGRLGTPPHDRLKIKVAQPPENNRANLAVIELLAAVLGIPESQISLLAGQTRPQKTFVLAAIRAEEAAARIAAALEARK